jgi:hypothetical protein
VENATIGYRNVYSSREQVQPSGMTCEYLLVAYQTIFYTSQYVFTS